MPREIKFLLHNNLPINNISIISKNKQSRLINENSYYHMYPKCKTLYKKNTIIISRRYFSKTYENTGITETDEFFYEEIPSPLYKEDNTVIPIPIPSPIPIPNPIPSPSPNPIPSSKHQCRIHSNYFIEISHDYGETWKIPETPPPNNCKINTIAKNSDGKYQISAGIYDSIYISDDYGETWIKSKNQPQIRRWKNVSISNDGSNCQADIYNGDTYISIDFGNSWDKL